MAVIKHGDARARMASLTSCVTLGKLLKFSVPLFPNLENGDNHVPTFIRLFGELII